MIPDFSIVTPNFRSLKWLKLCVGSVADQEDISFEHIIQDAGSDDGTAEWVLQDGRAKLYIEGDSGMYDGLNRGFLKARGEILGHLNSDEQYLPGALGKVAGFFQANPMVDILVTDTLVVRKDGSLLSMRRSLIPGPLDHYVRMRIQTCSFFLRKRVIDNGDLLDIHWKIAGDYEWINRLKAKGYRFGHLREFTSIFTETEGNLSLTPQAIAERKEYRSQWPWWVKPMEPALVAFYRLRALLAGCYRREKQLRYNIYTLENPACRMEFISYSPSRFWSGRH